MSDIPHGVPPTDIGSPTVVMPNNIAETPTVAPTIPIPTVVMPHNMAESPTVAPTVPSTEAPTIIHPTLPHEIVPIPITTAPTVTASNELVIRRSSWPHRPNVHLRDYICGTIIQQGPSFPSSGTVHPIEKHISFHNSCYKALLSILYSEGAENLYTS
ncbi:hypothetical protein NE237_018835 [Protea cynaroides]|uniref:Uncharacterized protein n=1 Tax=Protea cynaroides TaxID=273540 RepID=A0A9Q0KAM0_9MAGN|nr:hypothetical protein NE237_018835 [Protea cynaroides]